MRNSTASHLGKINLNYFQPPASIIIDVGSILIFSEKKLRVIAKDDSLYIPCNYLFSLVYREPRNIPGYDDLYDRFILEHTKGITHSDIVLGEFDELVNEMDGMLTTFLISYFGDGIAPHIEHYCFTRWMDEQHVLLSYK